MNIRLTIVAGVAACSLALSACGESPSAASEEETAEAAPDYERGPHNGRMLRDGNFAVEVTIF